MQRNQENVPALTVNIILAVLASRAGRNKYRKNRRVAHFPKMVQIVMNSMQAMPKMDVQYVN
jgi:hypothetical protein